MRWAASLALAMAFADVPPALVDSARQFVNDLVKSDFAAAHQMADPSVSAQLSDSVLRQAWTGITAQMGAFERIESTHISESAGYHIVYLTTKFANATADLKVVFGANGVAGFFIGPPAEPAAPPVPPPDTVVEETASVRGLGATITLPKGRAPFQPSCWCRVPARTIAMKPSAPTNHSAIWHGDSRRAASPCCATTSAVTCRLISRSKMK